MKECITILLLFFCLKGFTQYLEPYYTAKLPTQISETSGLEKLNDSIFVTHNDSGGGSLIYFIDSLGNLKGSRKLINAQSFDWEDITFDGEKYLYIGDVGNNSNQREHLEIHRYNIFDSTYTSMKISYTDQKFPTKKSNMNFDVEAMAYSNENIYLFTKNNTKPYTGYCKYYKTQFKAKENFKLIPEDSIFLGGGGYFSHSVTAADFSNDGKYLALLTYKHLFIFYDFPEGKPFQGKFVEFELPFIHQREAICFDKDNNIWITDEKSKLLNGGKIYKYDLSNFYSSDFYFKNSMIGIVNAKFKNEEVIQNESKLKNLELNVHISEKDIYQIDLLRNNSILQSKQGEFENNINENFVFSIIKNDNYSIKIYKTNKLIYSSKIISEN